MNPSSNQTAGTSTPAPIEGQASVLPMPGLGSQAIPGAVGSSDIGQTPTVQPSQLAPMTTIPLPQPASVSSAPASQSNSVSQTVNLQVADDKDVIEPEWVHKAKAIVLTTSDDPYKQSEELTVFKADYMQKRYNKTIKLK